MAVLEFVSIVRVETAVPLAGTKTLVGARLALGH